MRRMYTSTVLHVCRRKFSFILNGVRMSRHFFQRNSLLSKPIPIRTNMHKRYEIPHVPVENIRACLVQEFWMKFLSNNSSSNQTRVKYILAHGLGPWKLKRGTRKIPCPRGFASVAKYVPDKVFPQK